VFRISKIEIKEECGTKRTKMEKGRSEKTRIRKEK
jgi:hypothetical protein